MRSFWIGWALNPMSGSLLKRGEDTQRYTQRGGHMKTEAETGVMLLQGKEHQKPSGAEGSEKGSSPRAFRREHSLLSGF